MRYQSEKYFYLTRNRFRIVFFFGLRLEHNKSMKKPTSLSSVRTSVNKKIKIYLKLNKECKN